MTLIELIVVIAIISIMSAILVPSVLGYVRKARITSAIADAKLIKQTVENALLSELEYNQNQINIEDCYSKVLHTAKQKKRREAVGAFTNTSWNLYLKKRRPDGTVDTNGQGDAQKIEMIIASFLDNQFHNEQWKAGSKDVANPLSYNDINSPCSKYLKDYNTNFGLVVVYDKNFNVRFLQIYRNKIMVTYVNGEYIANDSNDATFIGVKSWDTVYTDVGKTAPEGLDEFTLSSWQNFGKTGGWFQE